MLAWAPSDNTVEVGKEVPPGRRTYDLLVVWEGFAFYFVLFIVCCLGILCSFMSLRQVPLHISG